MKILESMKNIFDKIKCTCKDKFMKKYDSPIYGYLYDYFNDNYIAVDGEGNNHSPVKLMKLFFFTYITYYKYNNKEILDKMQLWQLGPVSNVMYAKMYDENEFELKFNNYNQKSQRKEYPEDLLKVMEAINNFYGKMSGETLVHLVHQDNGWITDFPDEEKREFNGDLSKEIGLNDPNNKYIKLDLVKYSKDYEDINNPLFPEFLTFCNNHKNKDTIVKKLSNEKKYTFFYDNYLDKVKVENFINDNIKNIESFVKEEDIFYVYIIDNDGELYFN